MASFYACDHQRWKEREMLPKIPGYCIFIDVVDSVALKDKGLGAWCAAMCNLISPATDWLSGIGQRPEEVVTDTLREPSGLSPLKVIGDCIMFYVPIPLANGANALTVFSGLVNTVKERKPVGTDARLEVHAAVALCKNAYEVTFMKGTHDIHGKDIDLAARLLKEAGPQELVMNYAFWKEAKDAFDKWHAYPNAGGSYEEFKNVQGPWTKSIKGFKEPLDIFKWHSRR
jgi:class 3 adenylate cyclase